MKRMHVHVSVADLQQSIAFYSALFAARPSVTKPDYAKWMLDDPRVNFAISQRGSAPGLDHLGIQVEADEELRELAGRLNAAGERTRDEEAITCCYAQGNKSWISDPSGLRWEAFFTFGEATTYSEVGAPSAEPQREVRAAGACCAPADESKSPACCGSTA